MTSLGFVTSSCNLRAHGVLITVTDAPVSLSTTIGDALIKPRVRMARPGVVVGTMVGPSGAPASWCCRVRLRKAWIRRLLSACVGVGNASCTDM